MGIERGHLPCGSSFGTPIAKKTFGQTFPSPTTLAKRTSKNMKKSLSIDEKKLSFPFVGKLTLRRSRGGSCHGGGL